MPGQVTHSREVFSCLFVLKYLLQILTSFTMKTNTGNLGHILLHTRLLHTAHPCRRLHVGSCSRLLPAAADTAVILAACSDHCSRCWSNKYIHSSQTEIVDRDDIDTLPGCAAMQAAARKLQRISDKHPVCSKMSDILATPGQQPTDVHCVRGQDGDS